MFQDFTQKSFDVIMQAQEAARRMGHNFVGTEQLLLGMLNADKNEATEALSALGVSIEEARTEVENIIGLGSGVREVEIPFTPRAKRALELAGEEATRLADKRIDPKHILLGIVSEGEGVAAAVIQKLATTSEILPSLYRAFEASE